MTFATILGSIGALLFILCAVPLAWSTVRAGHCRGVSAPFLALWLAGELVMTAHVLLLPVLSVPLMVNYVLSTMLTGLVCWYRIWPRVRSLEQMAREWAE